MHYLRSSKCQNCGAPVPASRWSHCSNHCRISFADFQRRRREGCETRVPLGQSQAVMCASRNVARLEAEIARLESRLSEFRRALVDAVAVCS